MARDFGVEGLDLLWIDDIPMPDLDILFKEWQDAITLESRNSTGSKLILTAVVNYAPRIHSYNHSVESIQQHLDWVHVWPCLDLFPDRWPDFTAAPNALYNPSSNVCSTDLVITAWIKAGLSAKKIVLLLPYFGVSWTLVNPEVNGIGAPATGEDRGVKTTYMEIKKYINQYRAEVTFDKNYVVNYFTIMGTSWIAFDDVESIQKKVSYAKEKGLLGYFVLQVAYDDNWELSQAAVRELEGNKDGQNNSAAPEVNKVGQNKQSYSLVFIILPIIAAVIIILLGLVIYFRWMRKRKLEVNLSSGINEACK